MENNLFIKYEAIQIIRDTFEPILDPFLPHVTFGDTVADPAPVNIELTTISE